MNITIEDAIEDVNIAFSQVEFSLKSHAYWKQENLSSDDFVTDMIVSLPEGDLHFPTKQFADKNNILRAAETAISISYGCTALALDQVLETGGFRPNPNSDDNFDQIRCIIYLVRCAFAHRVACPFWNSRGDKRRVYQFDLGCGPVVIDTVTLEGSPFKFEHLGGHSNWHKMKDVVIKKLITQQDT